MNTFKRHIKNLSCDFDFDLLFLIIPLRFIPEDCFNNIEIIWAQQNFRVGGLEDGRTFDSITLIRERNLTKLQEIL